MSYVSEYKRIPSDGKIKQKLYLILKCDQCGKQFEQGNNVRLIKARPRHYCGFDCHTLAMKAGGVADLSRKHTCKEKYGSDYYLLTKESLNKASIACKTPDVMFKRNVTRSRNMQKNSIQLSRGLTINRSKIEIEFFDRLRDHLQLEIVCPKYVNGWFIDGYVPALSLWVQFDGVYWHSKPSAIKRDLKQDEWFAESSKKLLRITDTEWRRDPETCLKLFKLS